MIFSCFRRRLFQNVLQPCWTVYIDFHLVVTEVISNLLPHACSHMRLDPIAGSNAPKPNSIYASLRPAVHPKCALSARKWCIAQYRLKFQIIHCQLFFRIRPWFASTIYLAFIFSPISLLLSFM